MAVGGQKYEAFERGFHDYSGNGESNGKEHGN